MVMKKGEIMLYDENEYYDSCDCCCDCCCEVRGPSRGISWCYRSIRDGPNRVRQSESPVLQSTGVTRNCRTAAGTADIGPTGTTRARRLKLELTGRGSGADCLYVQQMILYCCRSFETVSITILWVFAMESGNNAGGDCRSLLPSPDYVDCCSSPMHGALPQSSVDLPHCVCANYERGI